MGPKHRQPRHHHSTTELNESLFIAPAANPALDAFNVAMAGQRRRPPKTRNDFGLRQFGDVIGRAKSTLNVIDVWKSKLVSASSSAVARQLASSSGEPSSSGWGRGLGGGIVGFGSKNKNKSACPPSATTTPGIAGAAKNEISTGGTFSTVAAASRIKRRLFKRNKSLDLDAIVPSTVVVDNKLPPLSVLVEPNVSEVLCRSVDNILGALVTEKEVNLEGQLFNRQRRRSSASALFPAVSAPKRTPTQRRRRRCLSNNDEEEQQLEATQSSSDGEENSALENVLNNNKLEERSYRVAAAVRESSKRSLGTAAVVTAREGKQKREANPNPYSAQYDGYCPILLLDKDFDLDDFYYYYWRKKLNSDEGGGQGDATLKKERPCKQSGRVKEGGVQDKKVIRAKLKLKTLTSKREEEGNEEGRPATLLCKRRLSDSALHTTTSQESASATIVEELTDSTITPPASFYSEREDDDDEEEMASSIRTTLSALGIPGKPRKKLSFKEPVERREGGGGGTWNDNGADNSLTCFRPRTGSLDSELEVLPWRRGLFAADGGEEGDEAICFLLIGFTTLLRTNFLPALFLRFSLKR